MRVERTRHMETEEHSESIEKTDHCRVTVRYEGRVQGVGFRWSTVRIAAAFPVTGFVRNEPDGTVRMTAEGRRRDLEAFLHAIEESHLGRFIRHRHIVWSAADGSFRSFEIRH